MFLFLSALKKSDFQDRVTWISLLFIPEARTNLLGRNLMSELGIGIKVSKENSEISFNLMTSKIESQLLPQVWTKDGNSGGLQISPIHIDLKKKKQCKRTEKSIPHSPRGEVRSETYN
jgi:hypothetical protein